MSMQLNALVSKITEYSYTVLVGKAKTWVAKFAIGAGTEAMLGKADSFIRATGTVADDGSVNVDALHRIVVAGFKSAGHIDLFGGIIGFDVQDVEDMFTYISGSGS